MAQSVVLKGLEDAIERKTFCLSDIKIDKGRDYVRSYILLWLCYLNAILNLNKPLTEAQMKLCAEQLLTDYHYLKLSELSFLFKRLINGEYGEFYESLSVAKIMTIFRKYDQERTECIVAKREREHAEFRYRESQNDTSLDFLKRQAKKLIR